MTQHVVKNLTKDLDHTEKQIGACDRNIADLEQRLAAARVERENCGKYAAELRAAIAILSPEGEPARAAA